ncbi:MAG: hypothetical protein NC823_01175, partial [Candidatus Omnitrophica bacterium]|nr:hypothetical protein [Candidatus Omnitrophota bacterium]
EQAKMLAESPIEKKRIALFELATWKYMETGSQTFQVRMKAPIPEIKAIRVSPAAGDPASIDWTAACSLSEPWYDRGTDRPAARKFSGKICHDGEYLYLELVDPCLTSQLRVSPSVSCYDDWELFVATDRSLPYRQYLIGPTGLVVALSHGEINWQKNVPLEPHNVRVISDTKESDRWVTRLSIPLKTLLPRPLSPGDTFYLNIVRVSGPAFTGTGSIGIDSWVSFCTVHDVDRLAKIHLER